MNVVFEQFVANALRRVLAPLGLQVRPQLGGRHLLRAGASGQIRLVPDMPPYWLRQR